MKITITYPESWAEIKYSQYLKYHKAVKPYEGTDDYNRVSIESAALHFCKVPAELLYQLPEDVFNKISDHLKVLFNSASDIVLSNQFTVGDTTYGFIPALDEMSYGEYLDLVSYSEKNVWDNIPLVFSILYRPVKLSVGKQYTIIPYAGTDNARVELFKHVLTMDVVFGAMAFFLGLQKDLLTGTLAYSMEILKNQTDPETLAALETLQKSGADITQLQSLLTMTLQNLTK
jgi:hypothetical protein